MASSNFERMRDRALSLAARGSTRHPIVVLVLAALLAAGAVGATLLFLEVKTDRNDLIREGRDWNERFERYRENFSGTRDLIGVVRGPKLDRRAFVDQVCAAASAQQAPFEQVFCGIDAQRFDRRGLLFFSESELSELREELESRAASLQRLTESPSLDATLRFMDRAMSQALVSNVVSGLFGDAEEDPPPTKDETEDEAVDLGFLLGLLEGLRAELAGQDGDAEIWSRMFGPGGGRRSAEYLESKDGRLSFILATPETGSDRAAIDFLEGAFEEAARPGVEAGVTGQRAINAAELRATVRDTRRAGIIALLGVALIFATAFGRVLNPVCALVALIFGIMWSAGATTLLVGHLTVLSVGFTSILVGLGIDFGIHVVARYEDSTATTVDEAIHEAILRSGAGNVAGALTTALAFYSVALSDFLGIAELGIIAGSGVLLCLLSSLTVLPALLKLVGKQSGREPLEGRAPRRIIPARLLDGGRGLTAVVVVVTTAALVAVPFVRFDGNLLNLQAEGVQAVDLELELIGLEGQGSAFAVATVEDLETARARGAQFEALDVVAEVESLARLIPPDQARRAERARGLAPLVEPLHTGPVPKAPTPPQRVERRLDKLRFKLRPEKEEDWADGKAPKQEDLARARSLIDALLAGLDGANEDVFFAFERRLAANLVREVERLKAGTRPLPMTEEVLPEPLLDAYKGKDGRYLLRIRPTDNIWRPEARTTFIEALRAVDPEVTGIPVQAQESSRLMLRGYVQGGLYSLLVVLALLWLDLRRPRLILAALVPLLFGAAWTCGVMASTGLAFNLANLVIVPLMIGIGIDIGVHMTHRHMENGDTGSTLIRGSTGRAVVVSGLTTIVGFGSLAIARHQGIQSIGLLLALGVSANLLAALFVLAPGLAGGGLRPRRSSSSS